MTDYTCFELEVKNHIAHLSMSRPDAFNAMTRIFWKELPEIIRDIDKNSKARVIVLSGQGKHFSAGMDLANFMQSENGTIRFAVENYPIYVYVRVSNLNLVT